MENPKFSFFYSSIGIRNTKPTKEINLPELFQILQSEKLKDHTLLIREAKDDETKTKRKLFLMQSMQCVLHTSKSMATKMMNYLAFYIACM
jgi:hypothetical protein